MAKLNTFHVVDLLNNEHSYIFDVCGKAQQTYKGLRSPYTFTFMHFADDFIQSDLQCIQVIHLHLLSVCVFSGN